ncbi:unnamed protein product [Rhizoctonia solani]|uniref:Uncharacterized protein n=1 Tax=Rhizoctonia solani TaxID=456999 RepID=A0A8H3DJF9_9AGAM|nr:unnamed protein product [Rhizoctonia solani]
MYRYLTASSDKREAKRFLKELDDTLARADKLLQGAKPGMDSDQYELYKKRGTSLLSEVEDVWSEVERREKKYYFFVDKSDKEEFRKDLDFLQRRIDGYKQDAVSSSKKAPALHAVSFSVPMQSSTSATRATVLDVSDFPRSSVSMARVQSDDLPSQQPQVAEGQKNTFRQVLFRAYEDGRRVVAVDNTRYREEDITEAEVSLQELSQLTSAVIRGDESLAAYRNPHVTEGADAAAAIGSLLSSLPVNSEVSFNT